jgi:hypothetical protein
MNPIKRFYYWFTGPQIICPERFREQIMLCKETCELSLGFKWQGKRATFKAVPGVKKAAGWMWCGPVPPDLGGQPGEMCGAYVIPHNRYEQECIMYCSPTDLSETNFELTHEWAEMCLTSVGFTGSPKQRHEFIQQHGIYVRRFTTSPVSVA